MVKPYRLQIQKILIHPWVEALGLARKGGC